MKYKSSLLNRPTRRFPKTALVGIVLILVLVLVLVLTSGDDENVVIPARPIESLDMSAFMSDDEISRQQFDEFEDVNALNPTNQGDTNVDPFHINSKIKKNQTLFVALKSYDLDQSDIHLLIAAMQNIVDFRKTKPGDKYEVELDASRRIVRFIYEISPEDITIAERDGSVFIAQKVDVHKKVEDIHVTGTLETSLYDAFTSLGESGELASKFMSLFKYDIDFGVSSQRGDQFSVLVEKVTLNGKFYRYGRLYAARYVSRALGRTLNAFYFDETKDETLIGYYDEQGRTLKRLFLKTPVVGCRMTSPYDPKRFHPILKRVRPHNGIDWAGQTGTHVMAFGDGVVTTAEWKGGNGNLLIIEHPHGYTSIYAHLYNFAVGIKKGVKVKRGQYVAQLGSTGLSTGPHLHFGVKKNGQYIDPASVDTEHAFALTGRDMMAFEKRRDEYLSKLVESTEIIPELDKTVSPEIQTTVSENSEVTVAGANDAVMPEGQRDTMQINLSESVPQDEVFDQDVYE